MGDTGELEGERFDGVEGVEEAGEDAATAASPEEAMGESEKRAFASSDKERMEFEYLTIYSKGGKIQIQTAREANSPCKI